MALTFEQVLPVQTSVIGVGLVLVPPRDAVTNLPWAGAIELERAPDSGGSPGTPESIAIIDHIPPAGGRYIDDRPSTTSVWWYRYRAVRAGATGTFGAWVSMTPGLFPRGTRLGFQADAAAFYAGVRAEPLSDGKFAVLAASTDGTKVDRTALVDGGVRTLYAQQTHLLPNGEFEVWESASQPHGWAVDTGDSSAAVKETSTIFSGDAAAKFAFGSGGSGTTWRGFATNDPVKGAFSIALRPGFRYRVIAAARVSTLTGTPKYRIRFQFNAGGSLTDSRELTYLAANAYQRNEAVISVPATADPNTKFWVEFQRGDTNAKDFWVDSVRFEEEISSLSEQAAQLAQTGTSFVLNGDFEAGTPYWRLDTGADFIATTTSPISGLKSGQMTLPVAAAIRVQQCDRASDLVNPTTGDPLYLPVSPFDEIWGQLTLKSDTILGSDTWRFGVAEYDAAKAFIQYTWIGTGSPTTATTTLRGGIVLSSTTQYVVAVVEVPSTGGGGGVKIKLDDWKLFWTPARRRCRVYRSTNQSLTSGTEAAINFDSETYDIGALHDTGSNTNRITVTAEMASRGEVRLFAQVSFDQGATGYRRVRISVTRAAGGSAVLGEHKDSAVSSTESATLPVAAVDNAPAVGDYYEVLATHTQGVALNALAGASLTWFAAKHEW
jgi:hypothetical protein